jgi:hypothetical protein
MRKQNFKPYCRIIYLFTINYELVMCECAGMRMCGFFMYKFILFRHFLLIRTFTHSHIRTSTSFDHLKYITPKGIVV